MIEDKRSNIENFLFISNEPPSTQSIDWTFYSFVKF